MAASVRTPTPADAPAVAGLAARTFRSAYEGSIDSSALEDYVAEAFAPDRVAAEIAAADATWLVAETGSGHPVGYAKLRAGDAPAGVVGPAIELERIYVDPAAIGTGVGASLMRRALEAAAHGGFAAIWLGVWEHNARALAFYDRWGFEVIGRQSFQLGPLPQTDLLLARAVGSG